MPKHKPDDVRLFKLVAELRFEEARFLFTQSRGVYGRGAVYLAGYAVECVLKALWLATTPLRRRLAVLKSFQGAKAHDLDWLRDQYLDTSGAAFPPEILLAFRRVNSWQTQMRYTAGRMRYNDAERFLTAVKAILDWGIGRL